MKSFGETLREAREAKGLTCSQVAAQTRLLVQIVEEMESEDFHRIAAPIYGRGFVRLYADCVGLDAAPLVKEFMEIYEGHRAPIVKTREIPSASSSPTPPEPLREKAVTESPAVSEPPPDVAVTEETALPDPEPPQEVIASEVPFVPESVSEPQVIDAEETFTASEPPTEVTLPETVSFPEPPTANPSVLETVSLPATPEPKPASETPPIVRGLDLFDRSPAAKPDPVGAFHATQYESPYVTQSAYPENAGPTPAERFKNSLSSVSHSIIGSVRTIPRSAWRITLLVAAAAAVIVFLVWGCIKLYQMTAPAPADPCADGSCDFNPNAAPKPVEKPAVKKDEKKTPPTKGKIEQAAASVKPAVKKSVPPKGLRSTGQKIPALYVD